MKWAKPGGQIAFALHARILFQQGNGMVEARAALFRALEISGVINGAELRNSKVWPEIDAPFCLLFARNQLPSADVAFRFVTPHLEKGLNGAGSMRIDAANADFVTPDQVMEHAALFKILFRGTTLDLKIFDRLRTRGLIKLSQYWKQHFGESRGHLKNVSTGYRRVCPSTKQPQLSKHLQNMPDLPSGTFLPILIDPNALKPFTDSELDRAREPEAYKGPLLIVHKSPPTTNGRIRVSMSENDLVFNEVYYGYSGKTHPNSIIFIRYLTLLVGSKPAFWYMLMTSGEFGFEREVVEKIIIDNIPIIPFESLDAATLAKVDELFDAIAHEDCPENWTKVDAWAASLYGLNEQDLQVIADTLRYNLPFAANKHAAQKTRTTEDVAVFCNTLKIELNSWAKREGLQIEVQTMRLPTASPWSVLSVSAIAPGKEKKTTTSDEWPVILQLADRLASTEVILPNPDNNTLLIARLNQARYWSHSQARLVARRIVWEHLDTLFGSETK
ncbi:hypothetical protein [Geotalea toluenoxydans]|uniref:hypothetical protein n=1 Tax=Geotalea toluenoxydans TaxID=421624 RepID=UPI0006D2717C|nr:hypothetical protein [Geotalea toluenoxydans]